MKFLKIASLSLLVGIIVNYGVRHRLFEQTARLVSALVSDSATSQNSKQADTFQAKHINEISFEQQQVLQQKYLTAVGKPGTFVEGLDEPEKRALIERALFDLYHSKNVYDRELAVMNLSEFDGKEVTKAMLYALNDPENLVRDQAISQIGEWANEKERTELALSALKGNDPDALVLVLESITDINDEALVARIKELLDYPDEDVRQAARLALSD